ncbi:prepilin-type N-terminal cleavage/methylation domain-containing protein [Microcoleus sp. Pol12B5]|uniref:prepilin-type N-terminal cleavage/methylation domain-containing protein n=1 Tax=unclassified Microcoleus TaxID=2642155 RepID=UPI002FD2162B
MKTPPILLKLLHNSAAKASPKFNKTASSKGDGGFTLLEVLVIALIVGILSSIAAPSWVAFINRQRVRTVNDRVLQTLRTAQSEAKRTKRDVIVIFNPTPATDPPTATINIIDSTQNPPIQTPPIQTMTFDAGGEIKQGQVTLSTNAPAATPAHSITFDYQGNRVNTNQFVVTVAPAGGGTQQCAIVETIIGGMRTDEGAPCN